jgi:2-polyprenyl-3-methyl-5-hydroxy-6-metoxy-1,4-benzoquinol methylase
MVARARDFDAELDQGTDAEHEKYAYGFDHDVMHPFLIRTFQPFLRPGRMLELGSHTGQLSRRLLDHSDELTCVDASADAVTATRQQVGDAATVVQARIEEARLEGTFDNVVMTHVLEHLDDPVGALRRINDEWLSPGGRLFLVCPNANAPSRQIAVHMGLISDNAAVTEAERRHGHRSTYALDTLEREARSAGLRVVLRTGVFFKALANFQWDRLLQTDIVSSAYLEGCYELGKVYPDLCASIVLVCEAGPGTP